MTALDPGSDIDGAARLPRRILLHAGFWHGTGQGQPAEHAQGREVGES